MHTQIELHIEELVLHGFAANQRWQIGQAIEMEIAKLLQQHGLPLNNTVQVTSLNAGNITLPVAAKPVNTGEQIAGAIYKTIAS